MNNTFSEREKQYMQAQNLKALIRQGQPQFTGTWFPYTSGEVGPYYIDAVKVTANGEDFYNAVSSLCQVVTRLVGINAFDAIAGGESRDWDFSFAVANRLKKPHTKIYETRPMNGYDPTNRTVVCVSDLNNEGSSYQDKWAPQLRAKDAVIHHAVFYVDRLEEGAVTLRNLGIQSHSVVPMDSYAWEILRREGHVSEELYRSLNERSEDRHAWARRQLLKHPEPLIAMLQGDEREKKRGTRILDHPEYAVVRDDLLGRMRELGYEHGEEQ